MSNKKDVPVTDLEASNTDEVKGGGGLAVNSSALQSINVSSFGTPTINTNLNPAVLSPISPKIDQAAYSTVMCPW